MEKQIVKIKSSITDGHYAFKNINSKSAFTNKMTEAMAVKLKPNDIVADIGGYVGEYSLYAHKQGVKKIYTYEPTPSTFELLKKNKKPNMEIFQKAVTGVDIDNVNLYTSNGIGVTNSIAKKTRKKGLITVPAIKYEEALKDANIVKIDVEGAEYSYNIIQPQLRAIIIEFHPIEKQDWVSQAFKIMNEIKNKGFKPLHEPKFSNGWDCHASYVRYE